MEKVNQILQHPIYQEAMNKITQYEKHRIYCKHGLEHQLDVARIAYILSLERGLLVNPEIIYGVGLLHDIGRSLEYEGKMDHEVAGEIMALAILKECSFTKEEMDKIIGCIAAHRNSSLVDGDKLKALIYEADKLSRACFQCAASSTCKWKDEQKNKGIIR